MSTRALIATILAGLIPLYAPLFVALIKTGLPKLPGVVLPGLAIVIGVLGDAGAAQLANRAADPVWGMAMGAAGVAVRELVDQIRQLAGGSAKKAP